MLRVDISYFLSPGMLCKGGALQRGAHLLRLLVWAPCRRCLCRFLSSLCHGLGLQHPAGAQLVLGTGQVLGMSLCSC